jgi:hypothetical protein
MGTMRFEQTEDSTYVPKGQPGVASGSLGRTLLLAQCLRPLNLDLLGFVIGHRYPVSDRVLHIAGTVTMTLTDSEQCYWRCGRVT